MPKKTAKKAAPAEALKDALTPEVLPGSEIITLPANNETVLQQIDKDIKAVETSKLIPFFVTAKKVADRLKKLTEAVRTEIIDNRLSEAEDYKNGHKVIRHGMAEIVIEFHKNWKLLPEKAEKVLRDKGLWEDATDLVIEAGAEELQAFLRKHRKEVKEMGLVVREQLNETKIEGLVLLKKLAPEDVEKFFDKKEPTKVFKPNIK